jgi:hypothetical protein
MSCLTRECVAAGARRDPSALAIRVINPTTSAPAHGRRLAVVFGMRSRSSRMARYAWLLKPRMFEDEKMKVVRPTARIPHACFRPSGRGCGPPDGMGGMMCSTHESRGRAKQAQTRHPFGPVPCQPRPTLDSKQLMPREGPLPLARARTVAPMYRLIGERR